MTAGVGSGESIGSLSGLSNETSSVASNKHFELATNFLATQMDMHHKDNKHA